MIIRFWDNENYDYPLIEIEEGSFNLFKKLLKKYKKEEDYNDYDFYQLLKKQKWFIKLIETDKEVFF